VYVSPRRQPQCPELNELCEQRGAQPSTHPKSQKEIAYWAEKEEEARRRIISTSHTKNKGKGRA
jgi:hypothetical protein